MLLELGIDVCWLMGCLSAGAMGEWYWEFHRAHHSPGRDAPPSV